jgi:hypothetical protein
MILTRLVETAASYDVALVLTDDDRLVKRGMVLR